MYTVVKKTDKKVLSVSGQNLRPEITFEDEYDGRMQICYDDGCYVLWIANRVGTYKAATHWPTEIIDAVYAHEIEERGAK